MRCPSCAARAVNEPTLTYIIRPTYISLCVCVCVRAPLVVIISPPRALSTPLVMFPKVLSSVSSCSCSHTARVAIDTHTDAEADIDTDTDIDIDAELLIK